MAVEEVVVVEVPESAIFLVFFFQKPNEIRSFLAPAWNWIFKRCFFTVFGVLFCVCLAGTSSLNAGSNNPLY